MNKYDYQVYRKGNSVFYSIDRNNELLTTREVFWHELNTIKAVFHANPHSEKAIKLQMKKAHELAKFAIAALEEYET